MPEEEKAEQPSKEQDSKSSSPKPKSGPNVIIVVLVLLIIQALVAFGVVMLAIPKEKKVSAKDLKNPAEVVKEEEHVEQTSDIENEETLPIKSDIVVNIAGTNGERYLKTNVTIAYDAKKAAAGKKIAEELAKYETQLKSKAEEYFSSLTLDQVNSKNARQNARTVLLHEFNAIIPASVGKLSNVYLESFIVQ